MEKVQGHKDRRTSAIASMNVGRGKRVPSGLPHYEFLSPVHLVRQQRDQ